jgi:hypothetical protein
MERRVVFFASCGTGTDTAEAYIIEAAEVTEWGDERLAKEAWLFAMNHAETYDVYPPEFDEEGELVEDGAGLHGFVWDAVEGYWEEYDANKHDGLLLCGTQKEVSWNKL